jgi:AcrR family transcriptional regulator
MTPLPATAAAPAAPPVERPLRADAQRNRERVLHAARAGFAEEGADVQMESIARRAGVGIGTLYRNFPTKDALFAEISRQWVAEQTEAAAAALHVGDPWAAVAGLVERTAEAMALDAGMRELFGELPADKLCPVESSRLEEQLAALVARAQTAGVMRADITVADFHALTCGMSVTIERGLHWHRSATILLDGLRAR